MKICVTLDDVIRAKTKQFGKIYQKYVDGSIDLSSLDISDGNLQRAFGMTEEQYMDYLFKDYPFEVFAEATVMEKMLDKKFNLWHIALENEEEDMELMLGNTKEFNTSIGYTYFFLSKIASRVREIYFPEYYHSEKLWNKCDVIVTADPELLKSKPEGKLSVKIKTQYNEDIPCDFSYDSLSELLDDNEFFEKLRGASK